MVGLACSAAVPTAIPTEAPTPTVAVLPPTATSPTDLPTRTQSKENVSPSSNSILTATPPPAQASVKEAAVLPLPEGDGQAAFQYLTELSTDIAPRPSGTEEELAAAEYLASKFEEFGYETSLREFTLERLSQELSDLTLDSPDAEELDVIPLVRSATGTAAGILTSAGLAREEDIPPEGLDGKIALVERGLIRFSEKVDRLAEAGAVGAVIYNNSPGNFQGVLSSGGSSIPAVAISREDGERLLDLIGAGGLQATVTVTADSIPSRNVVAEKAGTGQGVVVLGAHYDTVPGVEGANDNGSGTAGILAIAEELAGTNLPFTVRFIAFGSEELGLRGSAHYVDSLTGDQRQEIIAMLNFDALGSGESVEILGDAALTGRAADLAQRDGIVVTRGRNQPGSSSGHASLRRAGIPVLMFTAPNVSLIHSADDILEEVNPDLLRDTVRLAVSLLRLPNPFDQGI